MTRHLPLLALLVCLPLAACGGDDAIGGADAGSSSDASSSETTCYATSDCAEGFTCSADFGDCGACTSGSSSAGAAEPVCCGLCIPEPCEGKTCGAACDCPEGIACSEDGWVCSPDGECQPTPTNFTCDAAGVCDGLSCGDTCAPCDPDDAACIADNPDLERPHVCDRDGACSLLAETSCEAPCMSTDACEAGEVCTSEYGVCGTCDGGTEPVCCGLCTADPCADQLCGAPCDCPPDANCPTGDFACNPEGLCVPHNQALGCEAADACADQSCGASCGDAMVCDHFGACVPTPDEGVDGWCAIQAGQCFSSDDCLIGDACSVLTGACDPCVGSESEAVCCGLCQPYDPCAGVPCGSGCGTCPPDQSDCASPAVEMACNAAGSCTSSIDDLGCGPANPCEGEFCGTPCGDDMMCDATGACIVSPNTPADQWCMEQAGQCFSSADCEVGEACTVLYDDCQACSGSEMLAVCCGSCEAFDPCKDKACGDACDGCPPDQPDCSSITVETWCSDVASCSPTTPVCE